jgi:hypothetical protein
MRPRCASGAIAISLDLQFASLSFLFFDFDRQVVEQTMKLAHWVLLYYICFETICVQNIHVVLFLLIRIAKNRGTIV